MNPENRMEEVVTKHSLSHSSDELKCPGTHLGSQEALKVREEVGRGASLDLPLRSPSGCLLSSVLVRTALTSSRDSPSAIGEAMRAAMSFFFLFLII